MYCSDLFNYRRRRSSVVYIGDLAIGGDYPVRVQSMTNTLTMDTEACVAQTKRIVAAGGELVRLTAQGVREAENLADIHAALRAEGINVPLVADIHFNPKAAETAASCVEKVRINPGNFADPFISAAQATAEKEKIKERFLPFLSICKQHHTAIRIGVNHGSLSARMMKRYGDTPDGMVASCMEYLRICVEEDFRDVVISIKASNTLIMVQTVRLLVQRMNEEGMSFPLHLGVTEAGEGEDGRIKSAVGIGALLADGIGDTIRVSLSEAPEAEIPVARQLVGYISRRVVAPPIQAEAYPLFDPFSFHHRNTCFCGIIGGDQPLVVLAAVSDEMPLAWRVKAVVGSGVAPEADMVKPDFIYVGQQATLAADTDIPCLCDSSVYQSCANLYPVYTVEQLPQLLSQEASYRFLRLSYSQMDAELISRIKDIDRLVILLESHHINAPAEMRAAFHRLMIAGCRLPVVLCRQDGSPLEKMQLEAAADYGFLLLDGWGDGLFLQSSCLKPQVCSDTMFAILQAARMRVSKTEYISCPSCGRTLFDLQSTIARVKAGTAHLKGLKIAVMGCIVNGPGEMADADFGYVGAGRGKISLYKGNQCIEKNIPESEALDKLLALIEASR